MELNRPDSSKVEKEAMEWTPQGQRKEQAKEELAQNNTRGKLGCWEDMERN
jgi:hypothetical protein